MANDIIIPDITAKLLETESIQQQNMVQLAEVVKQQKDALAQLVNMVCMMQQRMDMYEKQLQQRATISSQQAKQLGKAVIGRASELCEENGLPDEAEKLLRDQIWKELLKEYHIASRYDLPDIYFGQALQFVNGWSSFQAVFRIRQKLG